MESVVYADAGYTGADKGAARKGLDCGRSRASVVVKVIPEGREEQAIQKAEKRKASFPLCLGSQDKINDLLAHSSCYSACSYRS
ncbi:hypothetical protein DFR29_1142 [Tahibacter aquaticus]|uniref:Uncharacterized protein n=1 Tax=Tahibacter aquaticus TaxID=520092 RepID=A0A4R6YPY2_9GAMM|nr:hypothetical protein DFR29_1142 [Tahibacter aquaticus]